MDRQTNNDILLFYQSGLACWIPFELRLEPIRYWQRLKRKRAHCQLQPCCPSGCVAPIGWPSNERSNRWHSWQILWLIWYWCRCDWLCCCFPGGIERANAVEVLDLSFTNLYTSSWPKRNTIVVIWTKEVWRNLYQLGLRQDEMPMNFCTRIWELRSWCGSRICVQTRQFGMDEFCDTEFHLLVLNIGMIVTDTASQVTKGFVVTTIPVEFSLRQIKGTHTRGVWGNCQNVLLDKIGCH